MNSISTLYSLNSSQSFYFLHLSLSSCILFFHSLLSVFLLFSFIIFASLFLIAPTLLYLSCIILFLLLILCPCLPFLSFSVFLFHHSLSIFFVRSPCLLLLTLMSHHYLYLSFSLLLYISHSSFS